MINVHWWRSGYDDRVHVFLAEQATERYAEALCDHTVPSDLLTLTDEGTRCVACVLILGDMLADEHEAKNINIAWGA